VIYDLGVGDARIRPDAQAGYLACCNASSAAPLQGNVGAGTGALVGKLFGMERAMRGGVGTASLSVHGITVGALVVCNAVGDVIDPMTGQPITGVRTANGQALLGTRDALLRGDMPINLLAGTNTTIGVIATDATLSKPQAQRLAMVAHDGLARAINPVHTVLDGDTLFALGTGKNQAGVNMLLLATLAAEVTARAVVNAVVAAHGLQLGTQYWPAAKDLHSGR
jgi:L-aminopeptidase/D-esterase-like protein